MYLSLLLLISMAPPDTWTLMEELRATRAYANGRITFEATWTDLTAPGVQAGSYVFHGDDAICSFYDPADAGRTVVLPTPAARRARIGPYQVSNAGHALKSAVSTSGYDFDQPIADWRQVGLFPDVTAMETGDHQYLRQFVPVGATPVLSRSGDGDLIRTDLEGPDERLVVWQDPARGGHVVRSQRWTGDILEREARVQLQQVGRDWFPRQVEYFRNVNDVLQPDCTVLVQSVVVDDPEADALTLEQAGVCVGTNVTLINAPGDTQAAALQRPPMYGWDGQAFVPMGELHRRLVEGELVRDPRFDADLAAFRLARKLGETDRFLRQRDEQAGVLSAWRRYTVDFSRRFGFDDAQRQKALLLCDQAERRAERIAARLDAPTDLEAARVAALRAERNHEALPADAAPLAEALRVRGELHRRLAGVFSAQLQPGLERLMTRQQRLQSTPE